MKRDSSIVTNLLLAEIKKRITWVILGFILIVCGILLSPFSPVITRYVLDVCLPTRNRSALISAALLYGTVYIISQVIIVSQSFIFTHLSNIMQRTFKIKLVNAAIHSSCSRVNNIDSGDFVNRIDNDVQDILDFSIHSFVDLLTQSGTLILSLAVMFRIDWRLALIILAAVPCVILSNELGISVYSRRQRELKKLHSTNIQLIMESWSNRKTLLYGRFVDYAIRRLNKNTEGYFHGIMKIFRLQTGLGTLQSIIYFLPAYASLFLGGMWVINGNLTIGSIVAAMSFMGRVYSPISSLIGFRTRLANYQLCITRLEELIDDIDAEHTEPQVVNGNIDKIVFTDLIFSYTEKEITLAKGVTMELCGPGVVTFSGGNGSGKTTLINIIAGHTKPNAGKIEIFLKNNDCESSINFLPQESSIFQDTIQNNILVDRNFPATHILSLAREIGFDDIGTGDLDLERILTDSGNNLSGGQKRKIAILRTLLSDARIIVLDEPFTGLDNKSKESFRKWLNVKALDRLVILVDHENIPNDGKSISLSEFSKGISS